MDSLTIRCCLALFAGLPSLSSLTALDTLLVVAIIARFAALTPLSLVVSFLPAALSLDALLCRLRTPAPYCSLRAIAVAIVRPTRTVAATTAADWPLHTSSAALIAALTAAV